MRPRHMLLLVSVFLACAGKNPAKPEHRRSAEEQEQIDNICGAEPADWKARFADEAKILEQIRGGKDPAAGRSIMRAVAGDARGCDAKTYRVCRLCMELEDSGKCPQIQAGSLEFCLEKDAGVSEPGDEAAGDQPAGDAAEPPAEPAE